MSSPSTINMLIMGGSGFLGAYCIIALLNEGYQVRTSIRSLSKASKVKESLKNAGLTDADFNCLSIVEADLNKHQDWDKAVEGCTYVLHVASPIPVIIPKNDNELILPACEGMLRVLRAAKRARVAAKRAAWDFVKKGEGKGLELTAINPVTMFGPVLGTKMLSSIHIIQRYMTGEMPASLNLYMGVVDVHDIATLHVLAMTSLAAKEERFIAVSLGDGWM